MSEDIRAMYGVFAKSRQQALMDFYLGQIVINAEIAQGAPVTSDDLNRYQLLDHDVETAPSTSVVGELIASLQRYIHAVYAGEEPGFSAPFDPDDVAHWREWESRYDVWAGVEQLRSYPENYIDPTLRIRKSEFFRTLESDLGQARLNEDRARVAILSYLRAFEHVANLDVMSGYIDGTDRRDAPYYFIGRHKASPGQFYWRRADVRLGQGQTYLNPSAWDEWRIIGAKMSGDVTHIRPVCVNGRLFVVWVERVETPLAPPTGVRNSVWHFRLHYSFADLNGLWAPSTFVSEVEAAPDTPFRLIAIGFDADLPNESSMAIALIGPENGNVDRFHAWDALFNPVPLTDDRQTTLRTLAEQRFVSSLVLQNRFPSIEAIFDPNRYYVKEIVVTPETRATRADARIASELSLSARYFVTGDGENVSGNLDVEATCTAVVNDLDFRSGRFVLKFRWITGRVHDAAVIRFAKQPEGTVTATVQPIFPLLRVAQIRTPSGRDITMQWDPPNGMHYKFFTLFDADVTALDNATEAEFQEGAGFQVIDLSLIGFPTTEEHFRGDSFSGIPRPKHADFTLLYEGAQAWRKRLVMNGGIKEKSTHSLGSSGAMEHVFSFGAVEPPSWRNTYKVVLAEDVLDPPEIVNAQGGGQFLAFDVSELTSKYVLLNTVFTGTLIQRASISLERMLDWDAQNTREPPRPDKPDEADVLDFNGANGRYFWEIFFHLPHLVAYQLRAEMSYADALRWLSFMFDPARPVQPAQTETPSYWRVRPLVEQGDANHEISAPADPDAIAYSRPVHYRKRIFRDYVETLIEWGDMLYRQMSRDSLTEAKMLYQRAARMMGQAPDFESAPQWTPASLSTLDEQHDSLVFADIEASFTDECLANLARTPGGPVGADLLAHPAFRLPLNLDLLTLWETIASRLFNLRHFLSIDGKPLDLPLYDTPVSPKDLMRAQSGDGGRHRRDTAGGPVVLPFRYATILPRAQQAVQTLCQFGSLVRQYLEQGDRAAQEEIAQQHVIEMGQFIIRIQEEMITHAQAVRDSMLASRESVQMRYDYYRRLYDEDLSSLEIASNSKLALGRALGHMTELGVLSAAIADSAPNIFGLANGGHQWGALGRAAVKTMETSSKLLGMESQSLDRTEGFRRRRSEWGFQRDMAAAEMRTLDTQLAAQDVQIQASRTSLSQQTRAMAQAEEMYTFLTQTRGSRASLFRWLHNRMATLYFQAYDATTTLCHAVHAGWQYEVGDYETHFIEPGAWLDGYYGLTAGESLSLALLKMDAAYVHRLERALVIKKHISLREHLGEQWEDGRNELIQTGKLAFELHSRVFDLDHPGHYLRQLRRVSVTVPAVIGPYQTLNMTLTQLGSQIVIKPDMAAMRYVYNPSEGDPAYVRQNLRLTPQVAVCTGLDDDGAGMRFAFDHERYEPFERMGAVSTWQIAFARHKYSPHVEVLNSITDIVIHIEYTAVDGGTQFATDVATELLGDEDEAHGA
ncbi:hypothetical protein AB870_21980 [Pandoraea faecigallinarum]|uniref:Toxin n=1 Tax=Pandoraea faecigallinarum TaxID=656179 RepID=A0A0H3X076_9BURK|nr:neuraminidase-like domain-containing protein [Pandoraea faecigallinarum]AKM32216.1 hypothetical protein AB870_21980 [Pandoraea faecigallinarum]